MRQFIIYDFVDEAELYFGDFTGWAVCFSGTTNPWGLWDTSIEIYGGPPEIRSFEKRI